MALTVLLVVLVPATYLIDSSVQQSAGARERVAASELAEQQLEQLTNDSLSFLEGQLNQNTVGSTPTVAGTTFSVSYFLTWQGVGNAPDLCASGSPPQAISATATVSWGPGTTQHLAEETVINPPYGLPVFYLATALVSGHTYASLTATEAQTIAGGVSVTIGAESSQIQTVTVASSGDSGTVTVPISGTGFKANASYPTGTPVALPNEGYVAAQIEGVSAPTVPANIGQTTVQITGSSVSQTLTPDSNGCVFAQELPGTYTLNLSSSSNPPFIDTTEDTTPTISNVTVNAGSITSETIDFDQAGLVTFAPSGGVPVAAGTPISVANSGITGSNPWTTGVSYPASTSSAPLYPFTSAYGVWYGDCLNEEPASPATVSVSEAGSASASVTGLGVLTVQPETTTGANNPSTATASLAGCGPTGTDILTMPATTSGSPVSQAAVPMGNRQDSGLTITKGKTSITDPSILSSDLYSEVTGPGIPTGTYISAVNTSTHVITLWSSPITSTSGSTAETITTTTSSATIDVLAEHYTLVVKSNADSKTTTETLVDTPDGVLYLASPVSGSKFYSGTTAIPVVVP